MALITVTLADRNPLMYLGVLPSTCYRRRPGVTPPHQTCDKLPCVSDGLDLLRKGGPGREAARPRHVSTLPQRRPPGDKDMPGAGTTRAGDQASDDSRVLAAITTAGRPPDRKGGARPMRRLCWYVCRQTGGFPVWKIDKKPNPAVAAMRVLVRGGQSRQARATAD